MTPSASVPPVPEARGTLVRDVAEEIRREDEEVLFPLMARISEIAELLAQKQSVDPEYVVEAVRLWRRYVDDLHERRTARLTLLIPPVTPSAAGGSQRFRRLRQRRSPRKKGEAPVESELEGEAALSEDQRRMGERIRVLEDLVTEYRQGRYFAREMLASLLRSGAFSDRAWAKFEEEFVQRYLDEQLESETDVRLREGVAAADALRLRLEDEVHKFLSRPIPVQPAAA